MKSLLTRLGTHLSPTSIHKLNSAINYLETGRWMHAHGFDPRRFSNRTLLHEFVAQPIKDQKVCYLEFGVSEGYSLLQWAARLTHQETQLHGFDSFEGLPEDWDATRLRGSFAAAIPQYDDRRVTLHKGWFNQTLPVFRLPQHEHLVVHLDADLYSSTRYVLDTLKPGPDAILIFDEFCDRMHELKAFNEYLSSGLKATCLGATTTLEQVAFKLHQA